MSLKNIGIIVDGQTEQGALKLKFEKIYCDCPTFRFGPGNGSMYSIEGYANGVLPTLIYLLNSNVRALILIPDLEKRNVDFIRFSEDLKLKIIKFIVDKELFSEDYLNDVIHICPPNIMFENWIISDIEGIKKDNILIKHSASQENFDGKNGTSVLKSLMTERYKKTVHAKLFFKKTRDHISEENSSSYKNFIECFNYLYQKFCKTVENA